MLPSCSGISSLQQIRSISLASLLKCPHFRSGRLELFCKRGALKKFAKFTGVSSGTGVSCEFCNTLKNFFFSQSTSSGCFCHLLQSRFSIRILHVINQQLKREYVQYLPMVERKTSFSHVFSL